MTFRIKIEGTKQNFWEILEFKERTSYKSSVYLCKCICGKLSTVRASGRKLTSKSCGCRNPPNYRKGKYLPIDQVDSFATLRGRYRRDASERNFCFELTREEFDHLIIGPCFYCGSERKSKQPYNTRGYIYYTGIDRVDNSKGYIITNCVSCCKECNILKKAVSKEIIEKAYHFLFKEEDGR